MNLTGRRLVGGLASWLVIAFVLMLIAGMVGPLDPFTFIATWVLAAIAVVVGLRISARTEREAADPR